jgi:hypothetical protein
LATQRISDVNNHLYFWNIKKKEAGKKSLFPLELNEKPNKGGRFATGFAGFFKCSAAQLIYPRLHSNLPPNYFWLFSS